MDIKRGEGYVLQSVPITADAVKIEELMKQDSITLSWRSVVNEIIPLGAYVEYEGERYTLLAPYSPSQISEIEYEYKPVFHSRIMRWQHIPFFHYNKVDGNIISKEPDWTLTDNPANFMAVICDAISNETGEEWTYSIADNLPASTSLSFSNVDIFSALNSIANAFNTEWWADKVNNVLHLSKASFGDPAILEVGDNIKVPSVTNSKDGYYTRFYAFGSTRNIAQDYQGANVNTQTNRRLTLDPVKYPNGYKDIRENLTDDEVLSKVLFFDKVYPKSDLVISDVRVRLMWVLDDNKDKVQVGIDENGDPIYSQYAIWYFKIPGYEYDENALIPAKPLSVHFNSGSLAGREFELSYDGKMRDLDTADGSKFVKDADDYEILFIEEGSYIIPAITGLVPNDGDEITLFNIVMPEEYKQSAYSELEEELDNEIARMQSDLNNYSFESNKVAFYNSNPNLSIGRSVTYKNGSYSYSTRVIKLETKIDYPFEQKITIGNEQIKGNTQELKEEVVNANQNIDLLASINEMTNSITQAYQRTQKSILDSISKYNDMFGVDSNGDVYVKLLPDGTPRNFYTYGVMSFGGIAGGESGEGGGTGITSLYDIPEIEVDLEALEDGQSLVYNVDLGKWVNRLVQGGSGSGVNMDYVWAALAGATDEKINASHIPDLSELYLPLTGGYMHGSIMFDTGAGIKASNSSSNIQIGMYQNDGIFLQGPALYYSPASGSDYHIWHEGNDGSGSGLDADLLDGLHASDFCKAFNVKIWGNLFDGTADITGNLNLNNGRSIRSWVADGSTDYDLLYLSSGNNFQIGYGTAITGKFKTNLHGYGIDLRSKGTDVATMSLTTNGNVLIGTTTEDTAYRLFVSGRGRFASGVTLNNGTAVYSKDTTGADKALFLLNNANSFMIGSDVANSGYSTYLYGNEILFRLKPGGAQPMYISSNGNVLIGYASDDNLAKLKVNGSIYTPYDLSANFVNLNGSRNNGLINISNTYNSQWLRVFTATAPNLSSSYNYSMLFGKADSVRNAAVITYKHNGDGSTANELWFGLHSADRLMTILGSGRVLIGANFEDNGLDALQVNGSIYASSSIKIGEATLVWDAENQCLVVDKNFVSNGTMSFGGFDLGIGNGSTIGEGLTINTSDLDGYVTPLILKANDIYAPLLLENEKGAYYLVPKDNGNFVGLALSTDSSASVASTTSNLVVRQLWAISSHITNLPAICIGTSYTKKATFGYDATNNVVTLNTTISQTSDITLKQIIKDVCLPTKVIADAPLFRFTWKNSADKAVHIGTSAQYWLDYAPELTALYDGKYTLDYATLGVLMGKSNAFEIEQLKTRVKELELKLSIYENGNS